MSGGGPDLGQEGTGKLGEIRCWDIRSGESVTFDGHRVRVQGVAFSPDGKSIASASLDGTAKVWDVQSRRCLATFEGHHRPVVGVQFSPDGQLAVSIAREDIVRVWDPKTGRESKLLMGLSGHPAFAQFSPDGRWIYAGSGSTLKAWETPSVPSSPTTGGASGTVSMEPPERSKEKAPASGGLGAPAAPDRAAGLAPSKPAPDLLQPGSVWKADQVNRTFTVMERTGERLRANFVVGNDTREIRGTIKDGQLSWLARDVRMIRGSDRGGDNVGKILDREIAMTWSRPGGPEHGTFKLRLVTPGIEGAGPVENRDRFLSLFNGKDKKGWKIHPSQPDNWRVENGILIGRAGLKNSHLYSEKGDYRDFHLRALVRINRGGNSGLDFRVPFGGAWGASYEAQIGGRAGGQLTVCSRPVPRLTNLPLEDEEWLTFEVIADGKRLITLVEGTVVSDFVDEQPRHAEGHVALELTIDNRTVVEFRKIEIRELAPNAINQPIPPGAGARGRPLNNALGRPQGNAPGAARDEGIPLFAHGFNEWYGFWRGEQIDPVTVFRMSGAELIGPSSFDKGRIFWKRAMRDFSMTFDYLLPQNGRTHLASCRLALGVKHAMHINQSSFRVDEVACVLAGSGADPDVGDIRLSEEWKVPIDYRTQTVKRQASAAGPVGTWNRAEVRCEGRTIRFLINKQEVARAEGEHDIICQPGFQTWDTNIHIRDVRITPLAAVGGEPNLGRAGRAKDGR